MTTEEDAVLQFKAVHKPNFAEANITLRSLDELDNFRSIQELEEILSKINDENPYSEVLFKGKYLFLLWEDLLEYQKPLRDAYKKSIAVFIAKKRIGSRKYSLLSKMRYLKSKLSFLHSGGLLFERIRNQSSTQAFVTVCQKYRIYPMPEAIGRKILEIYTCLCHKEVVKFPLVCICRHATNSTAGIVLGSSIINKVSQVSIRKTGTICKQELLPTLTELKESHLEGLPSVSPVDTSVFTCYEFLEYEPKENNRLIPILGTSLSIQSEWSNVLAVLEPLQPDCKTIVKVQSQNGNDLSGAYNLHQELSRIEHFHKCMKERYETNIGSPSMIVERIKKFMIEQKLTRPVKSLMFFNQITKEEKSFKSFDHVVLNQRIDLDFTDKLWLILKGISGGMGKVDSYVVWSQYHFHNLVLKPDIVTRHTHLIKTIVSLEYLVIYTSSVSDLNRAFEIFYAMLAEYTYSPGICRKNVSTIALDIRKLEQRNIMCPVLNASLMYKLLIEIGIEKLRKDYISIFVGLGILTFDSLKYFYEPDLISEDAVKYLRKLHSILELTIICVKRLSLPKDILSDIIRDTMKKCENNKSINHAFTFMLPPVKARNLLNPMRPVLWELSLVTNYNNRIKQTIHRYTTTPTRDHIIAPEKHHPKVMLKTAFYTYWKGLLVQDI